MSHQLQEAVKRGVPIVAFNPPRELGLTKFVNPQSPAEMLIKPAYPSLRTTSEHGGEEYFELPDIGHGATLLTTDSIQEKSISFKDIFTLAGGRPVQRRKQSHITQAILKLTAKSGSGKCSMRAPDFSPWSALTRLTYRLCVGLLRVPHRRLCIAQSARSASRGHRQCKPHSLRRLGEDGSHSLCGAVTIPIA